MNASYGKSLLFLAFFLSGASGLIYQTVWVRMLTRYLGATTHATATVLIVFMAGLALGSYLAARFADRVRRPLVVYCILELAIGASGLLASFAVIEGVGEFYVQLYDWVGNRPATLLAARVIFVVVCLLPPTILMGTTLPLMVSFVTRTGEHFQTGLGRLYALNTFGAVAGVLVTGLYLLGEFGERASLGMAAGLNAIAGFMALALARRQPALTVAIDATVRNEPSEVVQPYSASIRRLALIAIFVSGLTALTYEILWTRLLLLLLEPSIYAFSVMLATFLIGIAWGSLAAARHTRVGHASLETFGLLQIFGGFWAALSLFFLPGIHRSWLDATAGPLIAPGVSFVFGVLACFIMVLPIAYCFGLQFPLAVRCCIADSGAPGRSTGRAYAVNTLGTIVGALLAGFFVVPLLGTTNTMLLLGALNLLLGILLLRLVPKMERRWRPMASVGLAGGFVAAVIAVQIAHGGDAYRAAITARVLHQFGQHGEVYAWFESSAATTVAGGITENPRARTLLVNGMGMTELCTETKIMAHLPYYLAEQPKRMLIICFGMGTTFRSATGYPDLQVDAVDIVPEVLECFRYYHADAEEVLRRPNARRHADDGRNFLLTHRGPYDVITIDPAPPLHSAGAVNLYTKEFFTLCKSRLSPGGLLSMWLLPSPESELKMIMKTFLEVFPEGTLWGGLEYPGFFLIGGHRSFKQTPDQIDSMAEKLSRIEDLGEYTDVYSKPANLRRLFLLDAAGLAKLVGDVPVITDDMPYTEFPLWRQLNRPKGVEDFGANHVRERLSELMDR